MSARAIWKGTLSVGLVNLAVKAYKAYDEPGDESAMNLLHNTCYTKVNQKLHCVKCAKDIDYADTVKGFQTADGVFVVLSKDDLDSIKPDSSDVISVESFVDMADVDPLYVRETHYLAADGKAASDAYALLASVCATKEVAGQGRWTVYGREHNVLVRVVNGSLAVSMMRTVNEVRDQDQLPGYQAPGAVKITPQMMKIASTLIDGMMSTFDQTEYEDGYEHDFKALVAAKIAGTAVSAKPTRAHVSSGDLMAALTASLESKAPPKAKVAKASVGSGPKRSKRSA